MKPSKVSQKPLGGSAAPASGNGEVQLLFLQVGTHHPHRNLVAQAVNLVLAAAAQA